MAVEAIGGATGGTSSTAVSRATLADNFETFLTLLTTQLQHQNPLDPLDTNQFTQQLVAFAGVEQQLRTNDNLESLVKLSKIAHNATALSFVGLNVTAEGATTELRDGLAVWYLSSPRPAQATISIQDSNGSTVFTETKTLDATIQPYQWNGRTSTGTIAPPGAYKIVVTAKDAAGAPVTIDTNFSGIVDQVDVSGEEPLLLIGATLITLDQVRSVQRVVPVPGDETPDNSDNSTNNP
ncbi:MAG TPA: flagellar hook capping FlgD N-terminal domain-containing protein [Xanthobacteraceae bacterium]|jgi:flagellar basal-body rod modification protein FlgD